jgi:hypothetical protein
MPLLVTSASGANGGGYGALLAFDRDGKPLGVFSNDQRIADPRGLVVHQEERLLYLSGRDRVLALDAGGTVVRDTGTLQGLNPGGGNFGSDGRYLVGARGRRTVTAFPLTLETPGEDFLAPGIVPFPRGFAFGRDRTLFLGSGIGAQGEGDNAIVSFAPARNMRPSALVRDPELSPPDLAIAPNGNVVVSSEYPFGASDAVITVREYDPMDGCLVRVFRRKGSAGFHRPRGLRFGPDGNLYCAAQDEVIAFDFISGECVGVVARFSRLHDQALEFFD